MSAILKPLDQDFLKTHVQQFIDMCQRNMEGEYWDESNFLSDLPGKWKFSLFASDIDDTLQGFAVVSEKEQSFHIHKFVVDGPYQGSGVGSKMVKAIIQQSRKPVTLKVRKDNTNAVEFYQRHQFAINGEQEELYTMIRPAIS